MQKLFSKSALSARLKKWNLTRFIQLLIGGVFFMSGATDGDYMLSGVGLIFLTMALLNTGCGAMNNGSCEINPEENKQ